MRSDDQLHNDIYQELKSDPRVTESNFRISVKDGVVTLTGKASNYAEKLAALETIRHLAGVKEVIEDIEVRLSFAQQRRDEEIKQAILNALTWNLWVPKAIGVAVERGWVTLTGEVNWEFQKKEAENIVRHLMGVRGVSSLISIKPNNPNRTEAT